MTKFFMSVDLLQWIDYFLDNGAKTPRKNVAKKKLNRKNAAWNDHHQEPNKINLFWKKIKSTIIMYLGTLIYVVWDEIVAWVYLSFIDSKRKLGITYWNNL